MDEQGGELSCSKGILCADNLPFLITLVTTVESKGKLSLECHLAVLCQAG
jgi:hypothetical protein